MNIIGYIHIKYTNISKSIETLILICSINWHDKLHRHSNFHVSYTPSFNLYINLRCYNKSGGGGHHRYSCLSNMKTCNT